MENPRSRGPRSTSRVPAGAVPVPVFLPRRGRRSFRPCRIDPRSLDGCFGKNRPGTERGDRRFVVRAPRPGAVSQHSGHPGYSRRNRWALPQNAHPRRSAVFRKILFHAGRPGVPRFRHALRMHFRAGVLGSVVSGRRPHFRAGRSKHPLLSNSHRLASSREGAIRGGATGRMAHHPALSRHRQRRVCRGREPRGLRRSAGARARILGIVVRCGSVRPSDRRGVHRRRRIAHRRMRSAPRGGRAPELALSSRPPADRSPP